MASLDYPPTVANFIRAQASRYGSSTLIVHGERRVTYTEAEAESALLARGLLAAGVTKGTRVGLLMPNGPDWVLAWLAAARIGALVVPINTFYKTRELGWILHHADVSLLLTFGRFLSHDYLARLEEFAPELGGQNAKRLRCPSLPYLRSVRVWGVEPSELPSWAEEGPHSLAALGSSTGAGFDDAMLRAVEASVSPADAMVLIYSSGSTADPKGAIHGQGSVLRHALNLNQFRGITADDRIYSPMPFFWVGGFVFCLLAAMHAGATALTEDAFEPGATLDFIERERATLVAGWPHYGKAMAEHPSFPARDLSSVRAGNIYEILPEAVRPKDVELRSNSLGMTETCGPHTIGSMYEDLPERLRGSFGKSVPGLEHKIVDPETGETLPPGQLGEICVRGYSVMQGLYKIDREQTFDRDGFYHTGDSGYLDEEGYLFFKGRLGDAIKTGGANVSPREVEVVLEALPKVKQAYVVGLPDPDRGQSVAAAVVLQAGATATTDEIRDALRRELSAYKVPKHLFFYESGALPWTDTGKIDKRRLATLLGAALSERS